MEPKHTLHTLCICACVHMCVYAESSSIFHTGNHGIPRKWYFPFDPYYWWPYQRSRSPITAEESEVVTPVATENTPLLGSTKVSV